MLIYYINLQKRADRRRDMEMRLSDLKLEAARVEAVTPDDLSHDELAQYCDASRHFYLSPAELSCSLSHVRTMQEFLATGEEFCLILEDDAILSSKLPAFLSDFERSSPNVDILRLEADRHLGRLSVEADFTIDQVKAFQRYSGCPGAAGYIVSRKAAKLLTESEDMRIRQVDELMFNPYLPLSRKLKIRQSDPGMIIQEHHIAGTGSVTDSDIALARVRRSVFNGGPSHWRPLYRLLDFVERDFRIAIVKVWNGLRGKTHKRVVPFAGDMDD